MDLVSDGPLSDKKVALTGRLASMTHREAAKLIEELGGTFVQSPTRDTDFLVVGREGLPLGEDGRPTASLLRARKLHAEGYPIEIVTEDTFLRTAGLDEREAGVHRRYTIVQLGRILDVPRDRIRSWMRAGFIEPVEVVNRLALFDYQQVTSAKMLYELVRSGLTPAHIREGVERLRRWLPDVDASLGQLSILESSGRLLVRLDDGRLAEPSGQLQLEFESQIPAPALSVLHEDDKTADDWIDEATDLEDAGRTDEAAAAYRAAAELEPEDPVLQFNLGNVLYQMNDLADATVHFRRAVEIDPTYVEAWNNLGSVLGESGVTNEAILALRYAIEIVPTYADAHFNLAAILAAVGRADEACEHWQSYLHLDPTSPWADEARKNLAETPVRS